MSTLTQPDIASRLVEIVAATLKVPSDRIGIDADLETLGINSIIMMELIENIDAELSVALTPAHLGGVTTLGALAEVLENLQPGAAADASAPDSSQDVLSYISGKYAVDLSHRRFDSVDEIVDALVSEHSGDLLRHYGLVADPGAPPTLEGVSATADRQTPVAAHASDIAIIGMSCRLPDAPDALAFWRNLLDAKNSVREVPPSRWNWAEHFSTTPARGKSVSKWGALIADVDCFDAGFFGIPPAQARAMDPQQRLLLQETYRGVENAGLDIRKLAGTRTGVFIGYEYSEYEQQLRAHNNQDVTAGPLFSSSSPAYYLANRVSFTFDFRGPSESINIQCASSAVAINRAYYSLVNGESDVAIAGGVSLNLFAGDYIASSQYGLLSANGSSGVFDDDASGFTRGEGVAVIVLRRLEDARRNNDRIYGVIKSCHHSYRGAARSISEVRHEAFTSVLGECYRKAAIDPQTVRYIEVDGYATKWADSIEYEGIKNVFGGGAPGGKHCALGSVKGNIGNVEAATGVANVIKLALALHHKTFPATISKTRLSTFIDIDNDSHPLYIADRAIAFEDIRQGNTPIRAGINSFADSGTNVHILLEEYVDAQPAVGAAAPSRQLCILSAKDAQRLEAYVQDYIDFLAAADEALAFADLVYTLQTGREALSERLAIVAASRQELLEKLSLVRKTGLRAPLKLQAKEIYHAGIDVADKHSLASLITADMVRTQLQQSAQTRQWQQIALLWVNGVAIPWDSLWEGKSPRPAWLPCYPFAKDRHWIDAHVDVGVARPAAQSDPHTKADVRALNGSGVADGTDTHAVWHFHVPAENSSAPASVVALSRAEKMQLFLQQEAGRQSGKPADEISLDDTLADLGISSVGIAALINAIDRLLQTHLSPSAVFRHPQIGSFSAYLATTYPEAIDALVVSAAPCIEDECAARPSPEGNLVESSLSTVLADAAASLSELVVPVQTKGARPAVFALPGAGANALSLQQLSRALGHEQPFYCLEPPGLDGRVPPATSVAALAQLHIQGMRSIQSNGPYRLLGYSNGGVVAFEMARQLLQQREKIASLILLDTLCPTLRKQPVEEMMVAVFKHFVRTLGGVSDLDVKRLQRVAGNERSEYLYQNLVRLGIEVPRAQFLATFDVAAASEHGCRAYLPAKLPQKIDVTLFRATESYQDVPDDYGWLPFLVAPPRICPVKADHFSVVERDPVREVARTIDLSTRKSARKAAPDVLREAQYQAV